MVYKTDIENPQYYPVYNSGEDYWEIHCEEGVVIDELESIECAKAVAVLCCLGHIQLDSTNEILFSKTAYPDQPLDYFENGDDDEDEYDDDQVEEASDEEANDLTSDDSPIEATQEIELTVEDEEDEPLPSMPPSDVTH